MSILLNKLEITFLNKEVIVYLKMLFPVCLIKYLQNGKPLAPNLSFILIKIRIVDFKTLLILSFENKSHYFS